MSIGVLLYRDATEAEGAADHLDLAQVAKTGLTGPRGNLATFCQLNKHKFTTAR